MFKELIVCLCYLILAVLTVRISRVKALKDDDPEQPFTIYLDAGNEIGNVAKTIDSYGIKQNSMEQTLKSVQAVMEKIEQRLMELEKTVKSAANFQEIVEPFVKSLESRLSEIENKLGSTESIQQKNQALIEQRFDYLVLNLKSILNTQGADQKINGLHDKRLAEFEAEISNIANKANLKLEDTRSKTEILQPGVFSDCAEAKQQLGSHFNDGIYEISLPNFKPFNVYCMSECSSCCPWTIVMHGSERDEGNIFQRSWFDYKYGFGSASQDYFIGLDRLHVLTKRSPQNLLIRDYVVGNEKVFQEFSITDERYSYAVDNSVSLMAPPWVLNVDKGNPFSSDSVCSKMLGRSWWYNEGCIPSFGRNSFSDNIIMAIRPKACQKDFSNK